MISNKNLKKIKFGILLGCLCYSLLISQINIPLIDISNNKTESDVKTNLDTKYNLTGTHIYIDNTDPANDWAAFQATYAWCLGDGSSFQPYTIPQVLVGSITIKNSDAHFEITWCDQSGISLNNVTNGTLLYNDCSGSTGISLYDCHNNTIFYNDFSAHYGISAEYCTYNEIYSNNFFGYSRGIDFDHCFNNTIDENIISLSEDYGVLLYESGYNNVTRNDISTSDCGVYLASANHNFVFNNTIHDITDDWSHGIYLSGGVYNNISKNIIERCKMTGLYLEGDFNTISENYFDVVTEVGIKIESCSNFNVKGNILTNIAEFGISLINSETGDVVENLLNGCGFNVEGDPLLMSNLNLDDSNQVNSDPVYFYEGITGLINGDVINAGQIILYSCFSSDFSNLNLNNCTSGMALYYCDSNSISDSDFTHNSHSGINVISSNHTIMSNINASNNGDGVHFETCDSISITESQISLNEIGIYGGNEENFPTPIIAGTKANITDNLITHNKDNGIYIYKGNNSEINDNQIERNEHYGIHCKYSNLGKISGNIVNYNGITGIALYRCSKNYITDNIASYNKDFGFVFESSSNENFVSKNTLTSNYDTTTSPDWSSTGIYMKGCRYNLVTENSIRDHQTSLAILGSRYLNITKNSLYNSISVRDGCANLTFSKNLLDGSADPFESIFLSHSANCTFIENTLKWAQFRIDYGSENNSFIRNVISDCKVAFTFSSSSYNEVIDNSIYRALECFHEYGDCVGNIFSGNYCEEGFSWLIIPGIIIGSIALAGVGLLIFLRKRIAKRKLNQ